MEHCTNRSLLLFLFFHKDIAHHKIETRYSKHFQIQCLFDLDSFPKKKDKYPLTRRKDWNRLAGSYFPHSWKQPFLYIKVPASLGEWRCSEGVRHLAEGSDEYCSHGLSGPTSPPCQKQARTRNCIHSLSAKPRCSQWKNTSYQIIW